MRGWLHEPESPNGKGLVVTHGAGSNCDSPLLRALAEEFCAGGYCVLRCDLPYRQLRPTGPPPAGSAERDREGLRRAVQAMRAMAAGSLILAGHSYGGRQSSILASEEEGLIDLLLLLAYPLHPPKKREERRTAHFPNLSTPALFVHGARDPFGSIEEMNEAVRMIPAPHQLFEVPKTGHELRADLAPAILRETQCFATGSTK